MSNPYPLFNIDPKFRSSYKYKKKTPAIEGFVIPSQNRTVHGAERLTEVESIDKEYVKRSEEWADREDIIRSKGVIIELQSVPGIPLQTEPWVTAKTLKFELLNEMKETDAEGNLITHQRWFIRHGYLNDFVKIFKEYLSKNKRNSEEPKRRGLVDSIEQIREAVLSDLWTDLTPQPASDLDGWYEVWLRAGIDGEERVTILNQFKVLALESGIQLGKYVEALPEHTILHVKTKFGQLGISIPLMNCIAEIRQVYDYTITYAAESNAQQNVLLEGIKKRIELTGDGALSICVLDTGIERGHPLLEQLIAEKDNATIDKAWGTKDDWNHGTPISGLVAYGDLNNALNSTGSIKIPYSVEGVRIVPPQTIVNDDEKLAGYYTAQGVYTSELGNSERKRVWCISTGMPDVNQGRPSEWSAQIDRLASGVDNEAKVHRLFCISAGNVSNNDWGNYPKSNYISAIENPAQAWNSLCVGSFTLKELISPARSKEGYVAIAKRETLAPNSRTSFSWEHIWPNKPDIVFEGGNAAKNLSGNLKLPELDLLTTNAEYNSSFFTNQNGTSFATALAAQAAARIWEANPNLWAETIRGLMVHSASWTPAMVSAISPVDANGRPKTQKEKNEELLRTVGYGTPNIAEVLEGSKRKVYMIAEDLLQPFVMGKNDNTYNEYHTYTFPWPSTVLSQLRENLIKMRVTLSYFVEPNPGNRVISKYRYPGCQLRFKTSSPLQRIDDFKKQISSIKEGSAGEQGETPVQGSLDGWQLGPNNIFKGSIHSDWWVGTAAKLLDMKYVAIYPEVGWWKTRLREKKGNDKIKYSLIVSLEPMQNIDVDLYSEIKQQVSVVVEV